MTEAIERCAKIADEAVAELEAILRSPQARTGQYDRQTPIQLRYAVRWCKRIGQRIRALNPRPDDGDELTADPRFKAACDLLKELRPIIEKSGSSQWRTVMLKKMDDLLASGRSAQPDQPQ